MGFRLRMLGKERIGVWGWRNRVDWYFDILWYMAYVYDEFLMNRMKDM